MLFAFVVELLLWVLTLSTVNALPALEARSNDLAGPLGSVPVDASSNLFAPFKVFESEVLNSHNAARAQHGAAPLVWSEKLAILAWEWTNRCQFKRAGGVLGPFGENLAAGTNNFTWEAAFGVWLSEAPGYDPSNPKPSHWTQIVWKDTTTVGCAASLCDGIFKQPAWFYTCFYSQPGNMQGEFGANVQP